MSSADQKAPETEPSPPITTTTKEMMRKPSPMFGVDRVSGAASAPATHASAVPMAKTGQVHAARVDAEHVHHLGLLGRGADDGADPGALDPKNSRAASARHTPMTAKR